jgi:hypothetical protein
MAVSQEIANLFKESFKDTVKISKISPDLRGKSIVIYGGNNVGKTTQASKFKNPIFMPFEKGMNAISGSLVLRNTNWVDVTRNVKKLSEKKFLDVLKNDQITIIWDGFERAGLYCQKFIEQKYDVFDVAEGKGGYGLWTQYEKEFWTQVDKLLGLGYTVVFIGHADENRMKKKIYPKGDKRCVSPIVDNADIVVYLESNGTDKNGTEIMSSGYMVETQDFFARSRFPYVEKVMEEFSAENLEQLIVDGIKKQLESEGSVGVSFSEQQEIYKSDEVEYADLIKEIGQLYTKMIGLDAISDYKKIVDKNLGNGIIVSKTSETQIEPLMSIRDSLLEVIESKSTDTSFESMQERVKNIALKLNDVGRDEEYTQIIEKHLGEGGKVSKITVKQIKQLEAILTELELLETLEI